MERAAEENEGIQGSPRPQALRSVKGRFRVQSLSTRRAIKPTVTAQYLLPETSCNQFLHTRNADESEDDKEKTEKLVQKKQKELETLMRSYEEEIDAEISRMSNEAAIEKARHTRRMKTLFKDTANVTLPGSTGASSGETEEKMFVNLDKLDL